jgi:Tol biopolymer transport system component
MAPTSGREDGAIMSRSTVFIVSTGSIEKLAISRVEILRELFGSRNIWSVGTAPRPTRRRHPHLCLIQCGFLGTARGLGLATAMTSAAFFAYKRGTRIRPLALYRSKSAPPALLHSMGQPKTLVCGEAVCRAPRSACVLLEAPILDALVGGIQLGLGQEYNTMRSAPIGSPFLLLVLFIGACGGGSGAPPPTPPPPLAPTVLTAAPGNAQVSLTWNASSGAANYNLYRSASGAAFTLLNSSATTGFTDTGLSYGTPYCYQVTGVNTSGESAKSSAACATPQLPDIVFASSRALDGGDAANTNSAQNIWAIKADGTIAVPLTKLTAKGIVSRDPAWSPDKAKIAFVSNRAQNGSDAPEYVFSFTSGLWAIDVDGSHLAALFFVDAYTGNNSLQEPAWSPDGLKLSVSHTCCVDQFTNVAVLTADGLNFTDLTTFGTPVGGLPSPAQTGTTSGHWSPNGLKLIFGAPGAPGNSAGPPKNIWVMNADGSDQTALTNLTASNVRSSNPRWSPDGSEVAFSSSRALDGSDAVSINGTFNIWVMKADGTGVTPVTKLTAAGADCGAASWSPDGTKLAFECARSLDGSDATNANMTVNIWIVNADGTGAIPLTKLTAAGASSHDVDWSPDGSKLAFDSLRAIDGSDLANAASNIWVMNSDGSGATPLTKNTTKGADSVQPKWHP